MTAPQQLIDDLKYFKDAVCLDKRETETSPRFYDLTEPYDYYLNEEANNTIYRLKNNSFHIKRIEISPIYAQFIGATPRYRIFIIPTNNNTTSDKIERVKSK